jgi:7-carboxy-7-deazaguanine synthase
MKINEIFYSIQGEGKWIGRPNIFIRTAGCNLRCKYCDTTYAYESGKEMGINQILVSIKKYPCKYVCITGGEPLLQSDITELIEKLQKEKYKICLETNGSYDIDTFTKYKNLIISLDVKCPSSEMHENNHLSNIEKLRNDDVVKFVIKDKTDYNYAIKILNQNKLDCSIYFQPVYNTDYEKLAKWILKDGLNVNFSLQLHKIIWENKKEGIR